MSKNYSFLENPFRGAKDPSQRTNKRTVVPKSLLHTEEQGRAALLFNAMLTNLKAKKTRETILEEFYYAIQTHETDTVATMIRERPELVNTLLQKPRYDNTGDDKKILPLHLACTTYALPIVKLLVEKGADVHDERDGFNAIALTCFYQRNDYAMARYDNTGYSLTVNEKRNIGTAIVRFLVEKRVELPEDKEMRDGCLAMASSLLNAPLVEILISRGADPMAGERELEEGRKAALRSNAWQEPSDWNALRNVLCSDSRFESEMCKPEYAISGGGYRRTRRSKRRARKTRQRK